MIVHFDSSNRIVLVDRALMGIPSGHRTKRCTQTDRTREQTALLLAAGKRSVIGPCIALWRFFKYFVLLDEITSTPKHLVSLLWLLYGCCLAHPTPSQPIP